MAEMIQAGLASWEIYSNAQMCVVLMADKWIDLFSALGLDSAGSGVGIGK